MRCCVVLFVLIFTVGLSGCSLLGRFQPEEQDGPPDSHIDISKIPDIQPKKEPYSKYGNPPSYVVLGRRYYVLKSNKGYLERGFASWYGKKFHAKRTSSGEPYSMLTMTAAHKTLRIPTYVQVTNLKNGKHAIVRVNDRGPFRKDRIIDLSYVAAKKLGINGTGLVEVKAIEPNEGSSAPSSLPPIHGQPKIYLQVGAFSQCENAQRTLVQTQGLTDSPVFLDKSNTQGQQICRVQIGPLASVAATDQLANQLNAAGLGQPMVVIK